jgi:hypothetical protein
VGRGERQRSLREEKLEGEARLEDPLRPSVQRQRLEDPLPRPERAATTHPWCGLVARSSRAGSPLDRQSLLLRGNESANVFPSL